MREKKWVKAEKKDKKDFGGSRNKGSGNYWANPSDISSKFFLIESKQTDKGSYSISLKTWNKLYSESLFKYKLPLLSLHIQDKELVILSKQDLLKILKDSELLADK